MTVIFQTNLEVPLLCGDMLLSRPWSPGEITNLRLPSQPHGVCLQQQVIPDFIPLLMRRKLFLINKNLAIGVAGRVSNIRSFVEDVERTFSNKEEMTTDEVASYLAKNMSNDCHTILMFDSVDKGLVSLRRGGVRKDTKRLGRVNAIGSGSRRIIEEAERLDRYQYQGSKPDPREDEFPEFVALGQNLVLLANVYWKEFTTPSNIFESWGGAYDVIYRRVNGEFRYLLDYTIFFWLYDVDQRDKGLQLINLLKYERKPDVSVISMPGDGKMHFFGAKDITAPDEPTTMKTKLDSLSMNSSLHVSIFQVCQKNRHLNPIVQIDGLDPLRKSSQSVITGFDEMKRLWVGFQAAHNERMEQLIVEHSKQLLK